MERISVQEITISEWIGVAEAHARTRSAHYRPKSAAIASTYECTAEQFLAGATYLVRFTDHTETRLVDYNTPGAKPIAIQEFVKRPEFVDSVLGNWFNSNLGEIKEAKVITMHCLGCDRRLVIDGVHRIMRIVANKTPDAKVFATELSALQWRRPMPDMDVVCVCKSQ